MIKFPPSIEYSICGGVESPKKNEHKNQIDEYVIQRLFESFLCGNNETIKRSFVECFILHPEEEPYFADFRKRFEEENRNFCFEREFYSLPNARNDFALLLGKNEEPSFIIELKWDSNITEGQIEKYLSKRSVKGMLLITKKPSKAVNRDRFKSIQYDDVADWIVGSINRLTKGHPFAADDEDKIDLLANLCSLYSLIIHKGRNVKQYISHRFNLALKSLHFMIDKHLDSCPGWLIYGRDELLTDDGIEDALGSCSVGLFFGLTKTVPGIKIAFLQSGI